MRLRVLIYGILLVGLSRLSFGIILPGIDDLLRGDANNDTQLSLSDVIYINDWLFEGGTNPACIDAADVNDDGEVDITDAIYLNCFLFAGGPLPPSPCPYCGPDETEDELDCQESSCP